MASLEFDKFTSNAARTRNRQRHNPDDLPRCIVCDLPVRGQLVIRLNDTCSLAIPFDANIEADGGAHPIGPECAKKFPRGYVST